METTTLSLATELCQEEIINNTIQRTEAQRSHLKLTRILSQRGSAVLNAGTRLTRCWAPLIYVFTCQLYLCTEAQRALRASGLCQKS